MIDAHQMNYITVMYHNGFLVLQDMAVVWIVLCPGVYRIRKTQIFPAAFQNDFVQMADAGFSAPFMNLPEIDFFFMTLQIKGKITENRKCFPVVIK